MKVVAVRDVFMSEYVCLRVCVTSRVCLLSTWKTLSFWAFFLPHRFTAAFSHLRRFVKSDPIQVHFNV